MLTVDQVEQFLLRYPTAWTRADALARRLQSLEDRATAAPSPHLDGLPHGRGLPSDRTGEMTSKIVDTRAELQAARAEADRIKQECLREICFMPNKTPDDQRQRLVLEARYLGAGLEKWKVVNWVLFGTEDNFDDHEEAFLRRCHKLHLRALKTLSKTITMEE